MSEDKEVIEKVYRRLLTRALTSSKDENCECPPGIVKLNETNINYYISKCPRALIDFSAEWCLPCKILEPIFNKLAEIYSCKVLFGKVDVDENPELATNLFPAI